MEIGIKITVNGEPRTTEGEATLLDFLKGLGLPSLERGIAVCVNGEIVRKTEWEARVLRPDDELEIVNAAQGGRGENTMEDLLQVGSETFSSRLILGTARYPNNGVLLEALAFTSSKLLDPRRRCWRPADYRGFLSEHRGAVLQGAQAERRDVARLMLQHHALEARAQLLLAHSDGPRIPHQEELPLVAVRPDQHRDIARRAFADGLEGRLGEQVRSEEHTSELQSH